MLVIVFLACQLAKAYEKNQPDKAAQATLSHIVGRPVPGTVLVQEDGATKEMEALRKQQSQCFSLDMFTLWLIPLFEFGLAIDIEKAEKDKEASEKRAKEEEALNIML